MWRFLSSGEKVEGTLVPKLWPYVTMTEQRCHLYRYRIKLALDVIYLCFDECRLDAVLWCSNTWWSILVAIFERFIVL